MNSSGGNEQHFTWPESDWWFALDLILEHTFDDIGDLFARVRMLAERRAGSEIDECLYDFASGDAQIVPLEIGALDTGLLRQRGRQRNATSNEQQRHGDDTRRFHTAPRCALDRGRIVSAGRRP